MLRGRLRMDFNFNIQNLSTSDYSNPLNQSIWLDQVSAVRSIPDSINIGKWVNSSKPPSSKLGSFVIYPFLIVISFFIRDGGFLEYGL